MKRSSMKRATAMGCLLTMAALSVLLVGASGAQRTAVVGAGTLTEQVVARATIVAADGVVRVSAPSGRLSELRVHVGDVVNKGAVVAVVEHLETRHEVKAPIAGTVLAVLGAAGGDVTTGVAIFEMARLDRLEVRIEIDAANARHVSKGRSVTLRDLGGGETLVTGDIARVAPTMGPRTIGAADARIRAEGLIVAAWIPLAARSGLVLGQELEGVIALPEVDVPTLLPHEAVDIEDGHAIVRVPGRLFATKRRVRLGRSDVDHVEVLDLPAGTTVLATR
jgi:multidrug efflux pump subunit AcrA (membrane-fusion protein)